MTLMDRLSSLLSRKASKAGAAVAAVGLAPARWTPRRYDRLAEEGYRKNVVAYRCVREVARACASVPWLLYKGRSELDRHPLLDLLRRPNPRQSGPELIEAAIGHLLLSGNAYLEVVRPDDAPPRELYALRPDRMRVVPDVSGVPKAYRYEVEGRSVDWPVDPITGASDVLHLRDFHPLDDWYGLSPIEAAASAIDQHNAAAEHNAALLQNGARPSGALVFRSDPGPDGIRRVEEALLDRTQGPRQAGRPLVLGGDVDWKELGFSPKDMDFAQMKAQAAREISSAFGVPHLLVVSGEATFNNRADARFELWEHTVIPLLDRLSSALTSWLAPMFGGDLRLAHDLDEVPALAPRRRLKWQQIQAADFLTLNEKRQALGYQPIDEGAVTSREQKNSENFRRIHGYEQPRSPEGSPHGGRWARPSGPLQPMPLQWGPFTVPIPTDPFCRDEVLRALQDCMENFATGPRAIYGSVERNCWRGLVSERCGGNRVKSAVEQISNKCECAMAEDRRPERWPSNEEEWTEIDRLHGGDHRAELVDYMTARLAEDPNRWLAIRLRAVARQEMGDAEGARADFEDLIRRITEWLEMNPDGDGRGLRAGAYEAIGNVEAARADKMALHAQETARIEAEPERWHHWHARAGTNRWLGNHLAAYDDLTRVIALRPDISAPYGDRADVLMELGRFAEALADADRSKEKWWAEPSNHLDLRRADCYIGLGDAAAARACLASLPEPLDAVEEACVTRQLARCEEIERKSAL